MRVSGVFSAHFGGLEVLTSQIQNSGEWIKLDIEILTTFFTSGCSFQTSMASCCPEDFANSNSFHRDSLQMFADHLFRGLNLVASANM